MSYTQLTQEERYQIYALMKAGHNQSETATILQRHKSTISREYRRNKGLRGYRPNQAQRFTQERRNNKVQSRISQTLWYEVEQLLRYDWSPEQISLWLKAEKNLLISHEWIYQHILVDKERGGSLHTHLRCQKQRRKRYGSYNRRGQIVDRVSIDERPEVVNLKERIGDWECDTIIGKGHKQAIVSLTERKSRFTLIKKVRHKTAQSVSKTIIDLLSPLSDQVLTMTSDNGKEFANHKTIAQALETSFYFAHPYSPWERGLNENTNGLIRQYFPKNRDFDTITEQEINNVMNRLNNRPRKCLGTKTPNEVLLGIKPTVALAS